MDMQRANRISVQTTETGYEARMFRTHKHVATIDSTETTWIPDTKQNKTLQREMFRVWVCENSATFGIIWDPADQRTDDNKRAPKYTSDEILMEDAVSLVQADIEEFVAGCKIDGLRILDLVAEDITPMATSPKGTDLSKLGILDGKYLNGNWAWATVKVVATVTISASEDVAGEDMGYVTMTLQLVSGQLKKPTSIDGAGYTQTAFKNTVVKELDIKESAKPESEESEEKGNEENEA